MLSSCYNCFKIFSRECLDKTDKTRVTQDNPTIIGMVCVPVTPAKLKA
jgi:hypothetical protein